MFFHRTFVPIRQQHIGRSYRYARTLLMLAATATCTVVACHERVQEPFLSKKILCQRISSSGRHIVIYHKIPCSCIPGGNLTPQVEVVEEQEGGGEEQEYDESKEKQESFAKQVQFFVQENACPLWKEEEKTVKAVEGTDVMGMALASSS